MKNFNSKIFFIAIDLVLVTLLVISFFNVKSKPALDIWDNIQVSNDSLVISDQSVKSYNLQKHDEIKKINGVEVKNKDQIEYITDWLTIGDKVNISFSRYNLNFDRTIVLKPFYDNLYLTIYILTLLIYILISLYMISRDPNNTTFRVFHNLAFCVAFLIGMTLGKINYYGNYLDFLIRFLYDTSQILLSVYLLHFFLIFPVVKFSKYLRYIYTLYVVAVLLSIGLGYYSFLYSLTFSLSAFDKWFVAKDILKEIPSTLIMLIAILSVVHSYYKSEDITEKIKIRWIMIGTSIAVLNFILLWQIPKRLMSIEIIPEGFMIFMTVAAPISIFIAIFKYRLFNIDFIISRSYVYLVIFIIISCLYFIVAKMYFNEITSQYFFIALIIFALIIIFQPIKNKLQSFVDRKFFRQAYDYKVANQTFDNRIKNTYSIEQTSDLLISAVMVSMPLDKLGYMLVDIEAGNIILSKFLGLSLSDKEKEKIFTYSKEHLYSATIANPHAVEEGYANLNLNDRLFESAGIHLILQSLSDNKKYMLLLFIGLHKKRIKFSHEDIDAIRFKIDRAASSIQRISLTKEIIFREEENKKLIELSQMKSFFVSSVSHELKTPLTSIRLFAELLQINKNLDELKKEEYLDIIQSECDRLNRLINNVLDYSKIERGTKQYNFEQLDLVDLIKTVVSVMENQLVKNKFKLNLNLHSETATINADKDSLIEVFINLMSNSIKYSAENKEITITLLKQSDQYEVAFSDKGVGMSDDDLDHIFEAFYRAKSTTTAHAGGAGIGLSLVKSIIEAHHGSITAKSKINIGSQFIISLPIGGNNV